MTITADFWMSLIALDILPMASLPLAADFWVSLERLAACWAVSPWARSGEPSAVPTRRGAARSVSGLAAMLARQGRLVYDPTNPAANKQGYVTMPNVNPVTEMTDLIAESRSYEADAQAFQTAKTLYSKTIDLLH